MKRAVLLLSLFASFCGVVAADGEVQPASDLPYRQIEVAPLPDSELKSELEAALAKQDWQNMPELLKQYRSRFLADQVFADYAEARWRSSQGEYMQAQALYRRVLAQRPDWQEARAATIHNLSAARSAPRAGDFGKRLQASDVWQLPVNLSHVRNNQGYIPRDQKTLLAGNRYPDKNNDALRYNLGAEHDFSLKGNHRLRLGLTSGGTHYWDYYDRSTRSVRLAAGYRSSAGKQSWSFTPYTEQSWLGSEKYTLNTGASAAYNNKFNDNWRVSLSASSVNRSYNNPDHAKYYDGNINSVSGTAEWRPNSAWAISAGADYRADLTRNETRSSDRTVFRTGISRQFEGGIKAGASVQYGRREFSHSEPLYGIGRKDNEYNASASLSYQPRRWKGVAPKIDYRYSKIDSNVDSSSREQSQWFMSLEKKF
ncbi:surface lipoprotein assembly modifier [Neisseria wadsworthii]|uniref:Putative outer membrane protein n=1 Tax=Neisseria wadsworthii 9715 TaxID=1030841 RepID=G4CT48_9NEIS|nr:surface lipoprotein assembly modifier [Neisseria wadsworthii]EGZ44410.1 putative outer membrane protein [Neisseria wadsworthii 9715]QMT35849.1 DUF560 domain-containing protein [Neisseria wadsworthii]